MKDSVTRVVGRRIAAARMAAGMTQAEFAARVGWPLDTIRHYEQGRRGITVDRLSEIAATLGLPPAALLVDDAQTAALIAQILTHPNVPPQVAFFLSTLEVEEP